MERVQDLIKAKCSEDIVRLGLCAGGFVDRASQGSSISSYFQANSKSASTVKKASSSSSSSSSSLLLSSTMNSTKKQISEQGRKKTLTASPTQKLNQPVQYFSSLSSSTSKLPDGTQKEVKASKDGHVDPKIVLENHHDSQSSRATETYTTPSKESDGQTNSTKQVINESDIISQQQQQQQSPDLAYALKLQASYDRENEILSKTDNKMKGRGHGLLSSSSQRRTKKARIDSFFKLKK